MKRLLLVTAGVALAAVPAVFGLTDNPSLSRSVPVRIPSGAVPVPEHQINSGRVDHGTDDSGKGRRDTAADSGKGSRAAADSGKGSHGAAATPDTSGKGRHGAAASGKDNHATAATPPAISGKDGHGAAASGKDGHATAATPPDISGKGGHAAPAATAAPERGPGRVSIPETSVRGPDGNHGGGNTRGPGANSPDGGSSSAGNSGNGGSGSGK